MNDLKGEKSQIISPPIFFVHTPKTAGTSFRSALESVIDEEAILRDYGEESVMTSALVKPHTSSSPVDKYRLCKAVSTLPLELIVGHVGIHTYIVLTNADKVVSFLRNPVEQVISHWRHHVKYLNYNGNLEDFCCDGRFSNLQSRLLSGAPIEMIGHLLITERYALSLSLFNSDYGTELEALRCNQNIEKASDCYEISDAQRALIIKKNQRDIRLYDNALPLLERRIKLMKSGDEWTYGVCHPANPKGIINGWAYQRSHLPVEIELLSNGKVVAETQAVDYRPNLNVFRPPRKSCIGFQFKMKQVVPSGQITCRVKSTGQELSPPLRM